MRTNPFSRIFCAVSVVCMVLLSGCATQRIDLRSVQQGKVTSKSQVHHFEKSRYSMYTLVDLVPLRKARVEKMMEKVNPQNKPVANLKVTSRANWLAAVVNLLNGGAVDRGVLFSLNKVTIEGDIVE